MIAASIASMSSSAPPSLLAAPLLVSDLAVPACALQLVLSRVLAPALSLEELGMLPKTAGRASAVLRTLAQSSGSSSKSASSGLASGNSKNCTASEAPTAKPRPLLKSLSLARPADSAASSTIAHDDSDDASHGDGAILASTGTSRSPAGQPAGGQPRELLTSRGGHEATMLEPVEEPSDEAALCSRRIGSAGGATAAPSLELGHVLEPAASAAVELGCCACTTLTPRSARADMLGARLLSLLPVESRSARRSASLQSPSAPAIAHPATPPVEAPSGCATAHASSC